MLIPVGTGVGVTSVSLGVVRAMERHGVNVSFFKPVAQPRPGETGTERSTAVIRAAANINCRIFPGHTPAAVMAELSAVAAEPAMTIRQIDPEYTTASPASPYDPVFVGAATRAIQSAFGKVPVVAAQASGASDSMWYRALGVPSYGASGTFMRESDDFSHGLDERVPIGNIGKSLEYYRLLLTELSSQ